MKLLKKFVILGLLLFNSNAFCQDAFKEVDGLKYVIFGKHAGTKPVMGQTVICDILYFNQADTPIFNSIKMHQPVTVHMQKSKFKGDLLQGIQLMCVGDSAIFIVNGDSVAKSNGENNTLKPGAKLKYIVVLRNISNSESNSNSDDSLIEDYIKINKINGFIRTTDGLYYKIIKEGIGEKPKKGQKITVHYKGKVLNGDAFDGDKESDPGFSFLIGTHYVITGWDEAFALMNKGSKAIIIVPSHLAYGTKAQGPIPANSVLIFNIELIDIQPSNYENVSEEFDLPPVPPGGQEGYIKYLHENIKYPEEAFKAKAQGTVYVEIIVSKDGSLKSVQISKDNVGYGCGEEAVRVIKSMPPWTSAKMDGKPVAVKYLIPVKFTLH